MNYLLSLPTDPQGLPKNLEALFQLLVRDDQGSQELDHLVSTARKVDHQAALHAPLALSGNDGLAGNLGVLFLHNLNADHGTQATKKKS